MHFEERDCGDFRIYGGALDAPGSGFLAAVVVMQVRGVRGEPVTVFRDESLSAGHRFKDARSALRFAMEAGRHAVPEHTVPVAADS
ncbi:hypothetical protein [Methylibium sp.]|uniref:hypothetical protein n=1 Tax=Methylibium sp. TaxID=2067992 RepID=UPI003D12F046